LLYVIQLLSGFDVLKLCLFANPIIGGLSVFTFYFFVSGVLDNRKSLLATVLFTFCETHYYRTCHFATTESLGLFLMFLFLGFYLRNQAVPALLTLVVMPFAHTLPFIFSVGVVTVHLLLSGGKRTIILVMFVFLALFLATGIHTKQTVEVLSELIVSFRWSNIFIYDMSDFLKYFLCYSGVIAMSVMVALKFREWEQQEIVRSLFLASIAGMVISLFFYTTSLGPPRFLVYFSLPLIIMIVGNIRNEKNLVILVAVMIASPMMGGLNNVVWVADSITTEEIVAFEWFEERGYFLVGGDFGYNYTLFGNWFYDSTIQHYVELYTGRNWMGYPCFLNYKDKNATLEEQPGRAVHPHYVFLSERIRSNGLFIDTMKNGVRRKRSLVVRVPIEDIWRGDPMWREIYNRGGVVVYENMVITEKRMMESEE